MDNLVVKKKTYKVLEELGQHTFLVEKDDKKFVIKTLGIKTEAYSNYVFANKCLSSTGVRVPKLIKADKKTGNVLLEYIGGDYVFDLLINGPLNDNIMEKAFVFNWFAKANRLAIYFNPHNFKYFNEDLYYVNYTFDEYEKVKDFSEKGIKLWFYTNDFAKLLKEENIEVNEARIKKDFEQNKEILLTVVKYYR